MSVDAATVRRIARLARIAVAEDEVEPLKGELNDMLAFVEQLREVDIAGVEPMTSVTPTSPVMAGGTTRRPTSTGWPPRACALRRLTPIPPYARRHARR